VNALDAPTLDRAETAIIECAYRNSSDRMVIVRCCGAGGFYLERVIFPFELLSFCCPSECELEIWTHGLGGPELLETVHAEALQLEDSGPRSSLLPDELQGNPWWAQAG
jgi:hypothetical protein